MGILINDQEVFVEYSGGMVDAIVRAPNKETFEAVAQSVGLYYEVMETVTNIETGEKTKVGTGEWKLGKGVNIDHLGPVVISPGTYYDGGNIITPSTIDNRHHVNIRLAPPATNKVDANDNWEIAWTQNGVPDTEINSTEDARIYNQVSLIDPSTINTPSRIWA